PHLCANSCRRIWKNFLVEHPVRSTLPVRSESPAPRLIANRHFVDTRAVAPVYSTRLHVLNGGCFAPGREERHSLDKIYVQGGSRLKGEVQVGGSKNATLAIMAGATLVDGKVILHN